MRRILCAVDFSDACRKAFEAAIALCRDIDAGILLLHANPEPPHVPGMYQGEEVEHLEKALREQQVSEDAVRLSQWAEEARTQEIDVQVVIRDDDAAAAILQEAEERAVDMIVVGRTGKGAAARFLLGSVSQAVAQRAKVPVIIVPED